LCGVSAIWSDVGSGKNRVIEGVHEEITNEVLTPYLTDIRRIDGVNFDEYDNMSLIDMQGVTGSIPVVSTKQQKA